MTESSCAHWPGSLTSFAIRMHPRRARQSLFMFFITEQRRKRPQAHRNMLLHLSIHLSLARTTRKAPRRAYAHIRRTPPGLRCVWQSIRGPESLTRSVQSRAGRLGRERARAEPDRLERVRVCSLTAAVGEVVCDGGECFLEDGTEVRLCSGAERGFRVDFGAARDVSRRGERLAQRGGNV
jgi:hypothetical protein